MTKSNPSLPERAWLDVDLSALVRNARRFQQEISAPLLPMVKAEAYGLGAIPVCRALESVEPWGYGVATAEEGTALRAGGIERPIVVFTALLPDGADQLRAARLTPVIGDLDSLDAWLRSGGGAFHVEIDTGMARIGFRWHDQGGIAELGHRLGLAEDWEGVFTHFHSADSDLAATREQADRFDAVVRALPRRPRLVHLSSSAGAQAGARYGGDLARPGIFLYGGRAGALVPEPVAALRARVAAVRRVRPGDSVSYGATLLVDRATTIATLAIGYADGVPRTLGGGKGMVELNGNIVPIAGRVTMDMVMVDAGDTPVSRGDTATLFGGRVSLDDQATLAGTISYDLLTSISPRVARRYRGSS